ncbi:MAG: two-component sensor histidine kinase, partial [Nocardioides sp.]|nr:two-component sensor histidine kinase [Nocardioides sp.]
MRRPRVPAGVRRALTFWRRSVQARVVASTLVLSAVVITAVGWFLLQQTRDGLLSNRVDAVVAEASGETSEAELRLEATLRTEVDITRQIQDLARPIISRGETRGFRVVLAGPVDDEVPLASGNADFSTGLDLEASIPASLEERLATVGSNPAWTYTSI